MREDSKKWMLDVNDRYRAAAAIVIGLSSASFILPIFFLKDMAGVGADRTVFNELSMTAIVGWVLLALSILFGIAYHYISAKWVKLAWHKSVDILWLRSIFRRQIDDELIESLLDITYFLMMAGFLSGISCEIYFMINYKDSKAQSGRLPPVATPISIFPRMEFVRLSPLPEFGSGTAELPAGIETIVCTTRRLLKEPATTVAIVVGRHDQTELTVSTRRHFKSNTALAQQRARAIEFTLRDFRSCDTPPILNVIAVDSTPLHTAPNANPAQLADDRRPEIYLFRRVP